MRAAVILTVVVVLAAAYDLLAISTSAPGEDVAVAIMFGALAGLIVVQFRRKRRRSKTQ